MSNLATVNTVDYRAVFHSLAGHIERAYSLKINVGPVIDGQFDGKGIWVDLDKDPEEAVFILVHLFGHTVQWNLDENLRRLGSGDAGVTEEDLPRIYQYERQASQLGLALLEEEVNSGSPDGSPTVLEQIGSFLSTFTARAKRFGSSRRREWLSRCSRRSRFQVSFLSDGHPGDLSDAACVRIRASLTHDRRKPRKNGRREN